MRCAEKEQPRSLHESAAGPQVKLPQRRRGQAADHHADRYRRPAPSAEIRHPDSHQLRSRRPGVFLARIQPRRPAVDSATSKKAKPRIP